MRKFYLLLFVLFYSINLFGCQTAKSIEMITIYSMEDNSIILVVEDQEMIEKLQDVIASTKKQPGIVNMADPDYRIELEDRAFYLWLSEQSGTIMNVDETHIIYTLPDNAVKWLNELLAARQ